MMAGHQLPPGPDIAALKLIEIWGLIDLNPDERLFAFASAFDPGSAIFKEGAEALPKADGRQAMRLQRCNMTCPWSPPLASQKAKGAVLSHKVTRATSERGACATSKKDWPSVTVTLKAPEFLPSACAISDWQDFLREAPSLQRDTGRKSYVL